MSLLSHSPLGNALALIYQAEKRCAEELQRNLQIVKAAGCKTIPDFLELKRVQFLARGIKH